jgi:hypothetical protein
MKNGMDSCSHSRSRVLEKLTKVLIDGDIFRYRCAWAAERMQYLGELINANGHREYRSFDSKKEAESYGERTTKGVAGASYILWSRRELQPVENCLQIVRASLENALTAIKDKYGEVEYSIWLSGKKNFRDLVAVSKPYKGNRDAVPKPTYYMDVAEYLVEHWGATYTDGIEADDALGIAAMEAKEVGKEFIIVSNDKDLHQIPGLHYDWIKKEFYSISPKEAKTQLFTQILSGDSTDNVPGLEGIGPAKAAQILEGAQSPNEMVDRVVEAYKMHGPISWYSYLIEQARLVYILKKKMDVGAKDVYEHFLDTKEGFYLEDKYAIG